MTSWNSGTSAAFSPTINVTAAPDYEIRCSESWLSPTSKTDLSFKLHVTKNDSVHTRTATIILRPHGNIIGTITVTQLGVDPNLMVDTESWNILSSGGSNSFDVISNTTWSVEVDYRNSSDNGWVHVPNDNVTGNSTIAITVDPNTGKSMREATIKIKAGELLEEIEIVQYDEVSEEFVQLNIDNTVSLKSSSEYNHSLATWAMELSYAAYNPISNELIPGIPSGFMQGKFADPSMTAEAELESKGFEATMFNYEGNNSVAAHVIGHKEIKINNTTDINLIGEYDNNGDITGTLSSDSIFDSSTNSSNGISNSTLYNSSCGISDTVVLNADSTENETDNTKQLVVVAVRGSVTPEDWTPNCKT